jgi:hypothetical protein
LHSGGESLIAEDTGSLLMYIVKDMGAFRVSDMHVAPYNTNVGCIVRLPQDRYVSIPVSGSNDVSSARDVGQLAVQIRNVLASRIARNESLFILRKSKRPFRSNGELLEYQLLGRSSHRITEQGAATTTLQTKSDYGSQLRIITTKQHLVIVVLNRDGSAEMTSLTI